MSGRHSWVNRFPLETALLQEAASLPNSAQVCNYLLSQGVPPTDVLREMARFFEVPWLHMQDYLLDESCLGLVSERQIRRLGVLPLFRIGEVLYLASASPEDVDARDWVRKGTGLEVEVVAVLPADLEAAQNRILLSTQRSEREMQTLVQQIGRHRPAEDEALSTYGLEDREAPTIKLVDRILSQAIYLRASDIHLEPHSDRACLRYRIDGRLHEYPGPPLHLMAGVVSRIKIASCLDIAERRLPQDGRITITVDGKDYDLRVSVIPYLHGEGVVIRVLNPGEIVLDLTALGFEPDTLERYQRLIAHPYGIILVTGPTGSGKTTTLYATLKRIFNPELKFLTLEDPVEHQLPGINQIQMHADIGMTFGHGLRAILRHDPDVIMLGEIRDLESAEIAVRASLTGHLLFSTLHTNNATLAVTRLVDMGLPLYQVLASLIGVLAQRLMRRLCPACKEATPFTAEHQRLLRLHNPLQQLHQPRGCAECNFLGYRGRVAVYELLEMTPSIRRLLSRGADDEQLRARARKDGFVSMRESALMKLAEGVTSLEEVLSVTVADEPVDGA